LCVKRLTPVISSANEMCGVRRAGKRRHEYLNKRTERCAVARRGEPDGGHAAQHPSNIEMAKQALFPPCGSIDRNML